MLAQIDQTEKTLVFCANQAYALPPLSREQRADKARIIISTHFNTRQNVFLDFVLLHYVSVGVEELDQDNLKHLLKLQYRILLHKL